jgi:nucleoid-associated protein YgaU
MATTPPTSRPSAPLIAAVHSHTVAPGETYSSISAALFGNAKYWPEIAAANPKIDPKRLHPGLVLVIPDIPAAAVTPAATAAPVAPPLATPVSTPVAPIDAKTQYRVQSGDSLYRIAVRLYGNGNLGEKIYDINKDLIGPDPAKLKPGQILKLPQAPGQSTAAADAPSASASSGR